MSFIKHPHSLFFHKFFIFFLLVTTQACANQSDSGLLGMSNKKKTEKPAESKKDASTEAALSCSALPVLFQYYLSQHVQHRKLDPVLTDRTSTLFLKRLDPSRILLLDSELKSLQKDISDAIRGFQKNNCKIIFETQSKIIAKTKELETFVAQYVDDKKYALDKTVELNLDPDKRGSPKNEAQRNETLKKLVHFQISNYLASGTTLDEAKKQLKHRYELLTKRTVEKTDADLYSDFLDSFASALDPHTSYLSPEFFEDFNISMRLSLEGIGVSLSSKDGFTVVEEIIPGGAADRAKLLQPKDKIIAVSQDKETPVNIIDKDLKDVVKLIRGKKGTQVHLTILRQSGAQSTRIPVTLSRDKVDLAHQAAKVTYEERTVHGSKLKFAIVDLPSFYGDENEGSRSAYRDMKKILEDAQKEKVAGMVLDLSRNGGGLLIDAVRISGLFLKEGAVVATQELQREPEVLKDQDPSISYSGPLVVLTSRMSASSSEILAGALKDYKRAVIIGDGHTFGKGTVQRVVPLRDGYGALKVTTGMFFRPGGESTQHGGVKSHVIIPSRYDVEDIGEKSLDYSLEMKKIAPFLSSDINFSELDKKWTPIENKTIDILKKNSQARISSSKEFKEMKKKLDESKNIRGIVKLAEVEKEQIEQTQKEEKDKNKSRDEIVKELNAPHHNEAMNILADLVGILKPGAPENKSMIAHEAKANARPHIKKEVKTQQ